MIEPELQAETVKLATAYGWRVARFRGADDGLPDLVLSRGTRTIAIVFGSPTAKQRVRLDALNAAAVLAVTWTREDLSDGTVDHHLRRGQAGIHATTKPRRQTP
jgi:hypothetical protein